MKIQPITSRALYQTATNFKGFYGRLKSSCGPAEGCSGYTNFSLYEPSTNKIIGSNTLYDGIIYDKSKIDSLQRFSGHYDPNCYVEFVKPNIDEFGAKLDGEMVYFADPEEGITSDIRAKANYIVHDPEPSYPHLDKEVSKAYFEGSHEDYSKHYDTVDRYFKRLEKVDKKTLSEWQAKPQTLDTQQKIEYYTGRLKNSTTQQKNAADCRNIYNKSAELRKQMRDLQFQKHCIMERLGRHSYHTTEEGRVAKAEYDALQPKIQELQSKLKPYFEELKALYVNRGIKVIKHI